MNELVNVANSAHPVSPGGSSSAPQKPVWRRR